MALRAYSKQHGMKTSSVRIFTAYGPRVILNWEPKVSFAEGFRSTIEWFLAHVNLPELQANLEKNLIER
jgi:nucleoside-diphosphate-sugar epimerase